MSRSSDQYTGGTQYYAVLGKCLLGGGDFTHCKLIASCGKQLHINRRVYCLSMEDVMQY